METYFSKFPIISYNGYNALDITIRATIRADDLKNPLLYYPQELQDGQRADSVSDSAYSDEYMDWLVWITNSVVDPYYDWHMDQTTFDQFIISKYGTIEAAQSKVKYFRNNWYEVSDSIAPEQYDSLPIITRTSFSNTMYLDTAKKFYDPVLIGNNITAYKRKRLDDVVTTNRVVDLMITGDSEFIQDEIVTVGVSYTDQSNNHTWTQDGRAQVLWSNSSHLQIQHISGTVDQTPEGTNIDYSASNNFVSGTESSSNCVVTGLTVLAVNISNTEVIYYSPVSYYDDETEKNLQNKVIRVIDPTYAMPISDRMTKLIQS